jgi:hypothetical protein
MSEAETDVLELTRNLVDSIVNVDWNGYVELCQEDLTSYDPESNQRLVKGLGLWISS